MGRWIDEARTGAARELGARHYRGFMVLEVAVVVIRALVWLLPPVVVLGAGVWFALHLVGIVRWLVLAALVAVLLIVVARSRLLVPLVGLGVAAALTWLVWYAIISSVWWLFAVSGGLLLLASLVVSGRLGYWHTFRFGFRRPF